jgi:hypothetical protein
MAFIVKVLEVRLAFSDDFERSTKGKLKFSLVETFQQNHGTHLYVLPHFLTSSADTQLTNGYASSLGFHVATHAVLRS